MQAHPPPPRLLPRVTPACSLFAQSQGWRVSGSRALRCGHVGTCSVIGRWPSAETLPARYAVKPTTGRRTTSCLSTAPLNRLVQHAHVHVHACEPCTHLLLALMPLKMLSGVRDAFWRRPPPLPGAILCRLHARPFPTHAPTSQTCTATLP